MTETLGLNIYVLIGILLLLTSVGLIFYGLNNNSISKALFNISRLLALLSVIGIWYFGNINSNKTKIEIEENKKETAQAISKTKELELDVITAKKETQEAKMRTEKIKLEVEQANESAEKARLKTEEIRLEAENAKIEREKLRKQTLLLERQNAELKIEADRINSFTIFVYMIIEHDGNENLNIPPTVTNKEGGKLTLFNLDNKLYQDFSPAFGMLACEALEENKILYRIEYHPNGSVNTLSIETLNSVDEIHLDLPELFEPVHQLKKFNITNPINLNFRVNINRIEILNFTVTEDIIGDFLSSENYIIPANQAFKESFERYKRRIGRNK